MYGLTIVKSFIPAAPAINLDDKPLDKLAFSFQTNPFGATIGIALGLTGSVGAGVVLTDCPGGIKVFGGICTKFSYDILSI